MAEDSIKWPSFNRLPNVQEVAKYSKLFLVGGILCCFLKGHANYIIVQDQVIAVQY